MGLCAVCLKTVLKQCAVCLKTVFQMSGKVLLIFSLIIRKQFECENSGELIAQGKLILIKQMSN